MAFTATKKHQSQIGNLIFQIFDIDHTGVTEGTFNTGMREIYYAGFNNETTEIDGKLQKNFSAAATAANGHIYTSGFTNGDNATVLVIGR